MAGPWEQFQSEGQPVGPWTSFKKPAGAVEKALGMAEKAVEPITSYPDTYNQINKESRDLMSEGVSQASNGTAGDIALGVGKTALGGLGYLTSPINAALRTVVGKPVEENTGIPKEYTEFAASMALPIPKRVPTMAGKTVSKAPSTEELFSAADKGYEAARASPVAFPQNTVAELQHGIKSQLTEQGYRDFLAPKVFRAVEELDTGKPAANVTDIDSVRKALNKAAADPSERDAARRAVTAIDEFLAPKVPDIVESRGNYAAAKRSETIQDVIERATRQASSAGSGQNIDNSIRQQFKAILNNPSRSRGFSANEIEQMDTIVQGTKTGDAARAAGNILGGGGGLGTAVAGVMSAGIAPVFGYAFKKLGNAVTSGEVAKLDEIVRSRAPLAKAVSNSVGDWSTVAQSFETTPSIRNFARLTVASRNLSNNLKGVQITITPEDLLRTLQSPAKSAAEPDQQPEPGLPGQ